MSDAPPPASQRSVTGRRWLVAALVTLVFAALVARETSAAEIAARLRALSLATYLWALLALALAGVPRALRLQRLLPGKLSLADAYAFNQVYNVVTATIPSGLGEAASAWLMRRALAVPLHLGLVALVVTRVLDLMVLLGLFLLVVLGGLVPLGDGSGTVIAAAAALLTGLAGVAVLHALARERVAERLETLRDRIARDDLLG
ncbi:MAG TPA: lysylphosphatidylglycerol synthase domain-containing protein, partial [Polyangiales bacterium]|nr:lysylphosphatidylglycerol synthase domain-containing protein [Polyangiales bacterium]